MNCEQLNGYLVEYLDGRLEAKRRTEVEMHLAACAACRERAADFRALASLLEEWQPVEPSLGFDARLAERIESASADWRPSWLRPVYVAGLALLLVAVGIIVGTKPGLQPASQPVAVKTQAPLAPRPAIRAQGTEDEEVLMLENLGVLENAQVLEDFDVLSEMAAAKAKAKKKL